MEKWCGVSRLGPVQMNLYGLDLRSQGQGTSVSEMVEKGKKRNVLDESQDLPDHPKRRVLDVRIEGEM